MARDINVPKKPTCRTYKHNISERALKPFAICRRNFLFSKTNSGANASAILFSILQTARANGTVPELYLSYVLENINKKPLEKLLPWSKRMNIKNQI